MTAASRRLTAASLLGMAVVAVGCAVQSHSACTVDADCLSGAVCVEGLCAAGDVPSAVIAGPSEVALGERVVLDGSASSKADGTVDGLRYRWRMLEPVDVPLEVDEDSAAFLADRPLATYRVELRTVDAGTPSEPTVHTVVVRNEPPIVVVDGDLAAQATCSGDEGAESCEAAGHLSGSIEDVDGVVDANSVEWVVLEVPAGSSAQVFFTQPRMASTDFVISTSAGRPIAGEYVVELRAGDDRGATGRASVGITVEGGP